MVRSPSTSRSPFPWGVTRVEVNVNVGNFSTSRKSALRKCVSRSGSRVSIEAASIDASTWDLLISVSSIVRTPFTGLKCPLTLVIIICLTLNSAVVWTGSMFQVVVVGCGAFALILHSFFARAQSKHVDTLKFNLIAVVLARVALIQLDCSDFFVENAAESRRRALPVYEIAFALSRYFVEKGPD